MTDLFNYAFIKLICRFRNALINIKISLKSLTQHKIKANSSKKGIQVMKIEIIYLLIFKAFNHFL